jgi:hypothetical protein
MSHIWKCGKFVMRGPENVDTSGNLNSESSSLHFSLYGVKKKKKKEEDNLRCGRKKGKGGSPSERDRIPNFVSLSVVIR